MSTYIYIYTTIRNWRHILIANRAGKISVRRVGTRKFHKLARIQFWILIKVKCARCEGVAPHTHTLRHTDTHNSNNCQVKSVAKPTWYCPHSPGTHTQSIPMAIGNCNRLETISMGFSHVSFFAAAATTIIDDPNSMRAMPSRLLIHIHIHMAALRV